MHLLDLTEKNMNMNRQLNRMLCCRYGIHFTNFDRNFFLYRTRENKNKILRVSYL